MELEAQTAVIGLPVTLSLRGEPPGDGHVRGPWQITLLGEAGDLPLRVEDSVADPTDWRQGKYRLDLQGRQLDKLETLSGYPLPAAGQNEQPWVIFTDSGPPIPEPERDNILTDFRFAGCPAGMAFS